MSENIFISIIIPNYNKGQFIIEMLDSLKNQTYKLWEAIIIDDGSEDDSVKLIKNFQLRCKNIKLILNSNKNKGASFCRNIGIEKSIGEYVMFLDSDDKISKDCLDLRLKVFLRYPDNDFIVFPTGTFYNKIGDNSYIWLPKSKDFLISFLEHNIKWTISSPIWKRSALKKLKGFDEQYPRLQDIELHTRALLVDDFNFKVISNYAPDNFYRINEIKSSLSEEAKLRNFKDGIFMYITKTFTMLNQKKHINALRSSLFSLMNSVNYAYVQNKINSRIHKKFEKEIKYFMKKNKDLFMRNDLSFISIYNKIYAFGFWRIKGYNFIMKAIFRLYKV